MGGRGSVCRVRAACNVIWIASRRSQQEVYLVLVKTVMQAQNSSMDLVISVVERDPACI